MNFFVVQLLFFPAVGTALHYVYALCIDFVTDLVSEIYIRCVSCFVTSIVSETNNTQYPCTELL